MHTYKHYIWTQDTCIHDTDQLLLLKIHIILRSKYNLSFCRIISVGVICVYQRVKFSLS